GRAANVGVAHVPDERLDVLTEMYRPRRTVPAEITYVDLPAPPDQASRKGGMFTGESVQQLQKVDALLLVARAFDDPSVPHPKGEVDFMRDLEDVCFDLMFADIALLERRIERIGTEMKAARASERASLSQQVDALKAIQEELEQGTPMRDRHLTDAESRALRDTFALSALPFLVAVNIGEGDIGRAEEIEAQAAELLTGRYTGVAAVCAGLEEDLAAMSPEEEQEFRASLGAGESGLSRMIRLSYEVLGLISFLTVGEDEVRAWTIEKGMTAAKAAGRVHSDIERGFIRAEVVAYDDLVAAGSTAEARKRATLRSEGRDYVMQDGDVVNFLFSV
ncbi:MAG: DUF933 domain-containing protein, partial [Chloroflexota bacterium]